MDQSILIYCLLLVLLIADCRAQFFNFDLFNIPPIAPTTKHAYNVHTTRRNKINTVKTTEPSTEIHWKNTSLTYSYEETDRDEHIQPVKAKKRKQTTLIPTLAPLFNLFMTTTQRPVRKNKNTRKTTVSYVNNDSNDRKTTISNTNNNENKRKSNNNVRLSYNIDIPKDRQTNNIFNPEIPEEYYTKPYYEVTTKSYNNNNRHGNGNDNKHSNNYYNNDYTTKNPFLNRPGVKPAVIENRPPITNKPPTKRPNFYPEDNIPLATTRKPTTSRPYVVNPIPTDPGAVVYPSENDEPEIIKGVDEDSMSDAEKRRYIETAERMCDKYKALNTKQLSAIPLLPSPEPVSVNVSECSPLNVPLVIGGRVVSIKEFPHAALLGWERIDDGRYSWKCGGSLISDQWILTAAHCSYEERDNTVVTGPPRVAQLGSSYMDDPGAPVVRVSSVVRHPKYKFPRSYYDIALLKLMQPVKFSEVIRPACLGVPPPVRDPIIAVGWGRTQLGGDLSLELRAVSIPVWDITKCREVLGTSRKMPDGPLSDSQMCAGEERGGKDTCQGDSGGPAQIQDGCVWRVVAVTSLGRSCGAPNTPGLYAIAHRAFIAATVFGRNSPENNHRQNDYSNVNNNNHGRNGDSNVNNQNNRRENGYGSVNNNNNHRQNDYSNVNNNNHRQNDYSNVNNNNRGGNGDSNVNYSNHGRNTGNINSNERRANTNVNNQNNNRQNDNVNVNSNNQRQNDYAYVNNNNNHDQNNHDYISNERRVNVNVNNNNNRRQNDYSTTELYYNTRKTTTTTESYYNHDYNNRKTTTTTEYYNQDYYNRNDGENKRENSGNFGNNKHNPTQSNNRRTDFDSDNRNQQNYPNQNSNNNNHRQNGNNQDYWGNQRPNYYYNGGFDDAPVWWT